MKQLECAVRRSTHDLPILELIGDIDLDTSPAFREALAGLVEQGEVHIMIDLSRVEYLGSPGLSVLLSILKRVRERGGAIVLINPSPRIRHVFEISHLDHIFPICSTERQALELIQHPPH